MARRRWGLQKGQESWCQNQETDLDPVHPNRQDADHHKVPVFRHRDGAALVKSGKFQAQALLSTETSFVSAGEYELRPQTLAGMTLEWGNTCDTEKYTLYRHVHKRMVAGHSPGTAPVINTPRFPNRCREIPWSLVSLPGLELGCTNEEENTKGRPKALGLLPFAEVCKAANARNRAAPGKLKKRLCQDCLRL